MKRLPTFSRRQRGYSVVELLIAGTLGLVLLGGIAQLFVGSSQTFRMQRQLASIQDGGRFALLFLKSELELAGWQNDAALATTPLDSPVMQVLDGWSGMLACDGGDCTTNGVDDANDSITVRYEGTVDCAGTAVAAGPGGQIIVENRYFIGGVDGRQLMCEGNGGAGAQPLVDGIDSFQVLYGVDTTAPAPNAGCRDRAVDQYVPADALPDFDRSVVAIRFALLIRGETNSSVPNALRSYQVADRQIDFTDQIPRRVFSLTVPVFNRVYKANDSACELSL